MTGLLHRIRRRRPEEPAAPQVPPAVPAGTEPEAPAATATPSFRHRGRLRRRLRYLRRVREIAYRDIGGLVFDLRRFGRDEPGLVNAKLDALIALDAELRELEGTLGDPQPVAELREPGVGACPGCAALHASDARFCSACGLDLKSAGKAAVVAPGAVIAHESPEHAHPGSSADLAPTPGTPEPVAQASAPGAGTPAPAATSPEGIAAPPAQESTSTSPVDSPTPPDAPPPAASEQPTVVTPVVTDRDTP